MLLLTKRWNPIEFHRAANNILFLPHLHVLVCPQTIPWMTVAQVPLDQVTKKMQCHHQQKAKQLTRFVKSVVTKQKASILVDFVVNPARLSFEEPCRMIPTNHFSVFMARRAR